MIKKCNDPKVKKFSKEIDGKFDGVLLVPTLDRSNEVYMNIVS